LLRDGEKLAEVRDFDVATLFRQPDAEKKKLDGTLVRVRGKTGRRERELLPHARALAGLGSMRGYVLIPLHDGPLGIDAVIATQEVEEIRENVEVVVTARYLFAADDPDARAQGYGQILAALRVELAGEDTDLDAGLGDDLEGDLGDSGDLDAAGSKSETASGAGDEDIDFDGF
jgi:hypothetical protein